jgi:hypothetical protein
VTGIAALMCRATDATAITNTAATSTGGVTAVLLLSTITALLLLLLVPMSIFYNY